MLLQQKILKSVIPARNGACQKLTWRPILLTWKIEVSRISVLLDRNYITKYLTFCYLKHFKLYGPYLWIGFNCLKATEPLWGGSLLFTTQFPQIPGIQLIDLGRMKGWVDLEATQCFWKQERWECSTLTKRALLYYLLTFLFLYLRSIH